MSTVWTTDHVLVPEDAAADYGRIYEAILTLAWVGARHPRVRLATSVIVVPQRNAIVLAKELATLDSLSGGRVTAGVGIGWNAGEFANLARRGPLPRPRRLPRRDDPAVAPPVVGLDRAVRRAGSTRSTTSRSGRCRSQRGGLPIVVGGRAEPRSRRAGALADGYHSSATSPATYAERIPIDPLRLRGCRPPDAVAVRARPGPVRRRPRAAATRCAAPLTQIAAEIADVGRARRHASRALVRDDRPRRSGRAVQSGSIARSRRSPRRG